VVFGMNLQEALDAASVYSLHFPSSFYPRKAEPKKVIVEGGVGTSEISRLKRRGHIVQKIPSWQNGRVTAAAMERDANGIRLIAGASAKVGNGNTAYAVGW